MIWTVQLSHPAFTSWDTLCERHIATRRAEVDSRGLPRWTSIDQLKAVEIACADCETRRQGAPDYVTPTVAFVPTATTRVHPRTVAA